MSIPPLITYHECQKTFEHKGEPVLCCALSLPRFARLERPLQKRLERYYSRLEGDFLRWSEKKLLPKVALEAQTARERSLPFEPVQVELTAQAEENGGVILRYRRSMGEKLLFENRCTAPGIGGFSSME